MKHYVSGVSKWIPSAVWQDYMLVARLALALVFVAIAVLQLFAFEKLGAIMTVYEFGDGRVLAAILVVLEVLAVPFLLSMQTPRWLCCLSRWAGPLALGLWVFLISRAIGAAIQANSGFLGTHVEVPIGWLVYAISAILLTISIFLSAGEAITRLAQKL